MLKNMNKISHMCLALTICCFLTVFSQMPQFVESSLSSIISRIIWVVLILYVFISRRTLKINKTFLRSLIVPVVFSVFVFMMTVLTNVPYYSTGLYSVMLLSVFVFFIGTNVGEGLKDSDLRIIGGGYVAASIIVAFSVWIKYLKGADITEKMYLYASKNSIGIILLTAFIICYVYGWKKKKILINILNTAIMVFFVYVIMLLKCRAAIIVFPVIIAVSLVNSSFPKKVKVLIVLLLLALFIALQNDNFYQTIVENIILGSRGANDDLNEISSGRVDEWATFFKDFYKVLVVGDGASARESLILASYLQFGIFIGTLIICYAFWPLVKGIKWTYISKNKNAFLFLLIAIAYSINAILEQYSPFGPGVRCFYLWLLFGIFISNPYLVLHKPTNDNTNLKRN